MRYARLLLLLVALLLPVSAEASRFRGDRWLVGETIIVENRMGQEWNGAVSFTVNAWHRAFPRLNYRVLHRPGRGCRAEPGRIVICEVPFRPGWAGVTVSRWKGHQTLTGLVRISRTSTGVMWRGTISLYDMQTLCHEFGHALGLNHNARPDQSCVAPGSTRISPGSFDRQSLKLLYKRTGKP
jgi:hypothetical protein